eukprot:gnl/MRDRNA2_/MRDRNA2_97486_c0_seq1.p1 gnl/MRDRNA2_/MRDRNA2_97486_c0~~gnl/MRDRNA2_/MRDRNA2_97486_c0_seq1.p1  ORF type:complete len:191 (+),score=25.08 gnl/MRDRNA2_/MRDRNA2_97486_c0_seq1:67-639(+)
MLSINASILLVVIVQAHGKELAGKDSQIDKLISKLADKLLDRAMKEVTLSHERSIPRTELMSTDALRPNQPGFQPELAIQNHDSVAPTLDQRMAPLSNSRKMAEITKLATEIKTEMFGHIESVLERGEKLDVLRVKTDGLHFAANTFSRSRAALSRVLARNKQKSYAFMAFGAAALMFIVWLICYLTVSD